MKKRPRIVFKSDAFVKGVRVVLKSVKSGDRAGVVTSRQRDYVSVRFDDGNQWHGPAGLLDPEPQA